MKDFCSLRCGIDTVEITKLMGFVQHQHIEAVIGNLFQIRPRRMIGRDDGTYVVRFGGNKFASGDNLTEDIELRLKLVLPLRAEQFGSDNQDLGDAVSGDK